MNIKDKINNISPKILIITIIVLTILSIALLIALIVMIVKNQSKKDGARIRDDNLSNIQPFIINENSRQHKRYEPYRRQNHNKKVAKNAATQTTNDNLKDNDKKSEDKKIIKTNNSSSQTENISSKDIAVNDNNRNSSNTNNSNPGIEKNIDTLTSKEKNTNNENKKSEIKTQPDIETNSTANRLNNLSTNKATTDNNKNNNEKAQHSKNTNDQITQPLKRNTDSMGERSRSAPNLSITAVVPNPPQQPLSPQNRIYTDEQIFEKLEYFRVNEKLIEKLRKPEILNNIKVRVVRYLNQLDDEELREKREQEEVNEFLQRVKNREINFSNENNKKNDTNRRILIAGLENCIKNFSIVDKSKEKAKKQNTAPIDLNDITNQIYEIFKRNDKTLKETLLQNIIITIKEKIDNDYALKKCEANGISIDNLIKLKIYHYMKSSNIQFTDEEKNILSSIEDLLSQAKTPDIKSIMEKIENPKVEGLNNKDGLEKILSKTELCRALHSLIQIGNHTTIKSALLKEKLFALNFLVKFYSDENFAKKLIHEILKIEVQNDMTFSILKKNLEKNNNQSQDQNIINSIIQVYKKKRGPIDNEALINENLNPKKNTEHRRGTEKPVKIKKGFDAQRILNFINENHDGLGQIVDDFLSENGINPAEKENYMKILNDNNTEELIKKAYGSAVGAQKVIFENPNDLEALLKIILNTYKNNCMDAKNPNQNAPSALITTSDITPISQGMSPPPPPPPPPPLPAEFLFNNGNHIRSQLITVDA